MPTESQALKVLMKKAVQLKWLLAVAVAGLAVGYLSIAMAGTNPPANANHRADPSQFEKGVLSNDAVAQAKAFDEFPLVWLGEEFEDFQLTSFVRAKSPGQNAVYLVYGTCTPRPGMVEPSCVPPLSIVTSAPGSVPAPGAVEEDVAGTIETVRNVPSRILSGNLFLWTGGVIITVDANSGQQAAATAALETVNHDALHRPPVRAGESLAVLAP